jgi:manganese efflux pump family protein
VTVQHKEVFEFLFLMATLAIDVFFVAASLGVYKVSSTIQYLFLLYVGAFHLLFSMAGIVLGTYLHALMGNVSGLVGAIIIIVTGLFFLLSSIRSAKGIEVTLNPNVWSLALAVSMECFSVGIGVSMHLHMVVAMVLCFTAVGLISGYIGIQVGRILGGQFGVSADIVGSLCLIFVGVLFLAW